MAKISSFKGWRYNSDKIKNLADVLVPPYDVISKEEQEEFDKITTQKKRLEDAFKSQLKHLEEREKEVKNELKLLSATKGKV